MRVGWILGIVTGCGYISEGNKDLRMDPDHDGVPWMVDCDDNDATIGGERTWYVDSDGDGYGNTEESIMACTKPEGAVEIDQDCDDTDNSIYPGADDVFYDGIDSDCDGANDCDADLDGYDGSETGLPTDACPEASDCNDTDPDIYPDPSLSELFFNSEDDDCNLATGDGDADGDGYWHINYAEIVEERGLVPLDIPEGAEGDCYDSLNFPYEGFEINPINGFDDLSPSEVNPAATERYYDGIDQDCSGDAEMDFDQDGDGFNSKHFYDSTGELGLDCIDSIDDSDFFPTNLAPVDINPQAAEIWYDGIDQDCAGDSDFDADKDGEEIISIDCNGVADSVTCDFDGDGNDNFTGGSDCNDDPSNDGDLYNAAAEEIVNDGKDFNCDTLELCYEDIDGDTYGSDNEVFYGGGFTGDHTNVQCPSPNTYVCSDAQYTNENDCTVNGLCSDPSLLTDEDCFPPEVWTTNTWSLQITGVSSFNNDCDDDESSVSPDSTITPEICDGLNNDCVDGVPSNELDADGDGYVECEIDSSGWAGAAVNGGEDCDDSDMFTYPSAASNDSSNDCMTDVDGDGYGSTSPIVGVAGTDCDDSNSNSTTLANDQDCDGYPTIDDCNDVDSTIYPGAPETQEALTAIDENCDGMELGGYEKCTSLLNGDDYYLFCADQENWITANSTCTSYGYDALTSVHSSIENDLLKDGPPNALEVPVRYWIGLNDRSIEGDFVWSDGTTFDGSYTSWGSLQPDNGMFGSGNEDCVHFDPSPSNAGEWSDADCIDTNGFICVTRM
jgi:hypothetical protein